VTDFSQSIPGNDIKPLGLFVQITILVTPLVTSRNAKGSDRRAGSSVTKFRVGAKATND
jgi:hypothetical protein